MFLKMSGEKKNLPSTSGLLYLSLSSSQSSVTTVSTTLGTSLSILNKIQKQFSFLFVYQTGISKEIFTNEKKEFKRTYKGTDFQNLYF